MGLHEGMLAEIGYGVEVEVEGFARQDRFAGERSVPGAEQGCDFLRGNAREYSDRKLFFGMTLRPENRPRPSSATSAMMWFLRSIDQSLSAREASKACGAGII